MSEVRSLTPMQIKNYLPHRYPFLLVDKVIDYREDYVKAIKNVTFNEEFFVGHFPDRPVMPGVLIIEAMAQTSCFMMFDELEGSSKKLGVLFMGIENVRFKKMVVPGDQLVMEAKLIKKKRGFWWIQVVATVDGEIATEASFSALLQPEEQ